MTKLKLSSFLLLWILVYSVVSGQTQKDFFKYYNNKVGLITNDSGFQKVSLSNKMYGSLTGYFKNDSIYVVEGYYKQLYGKLEFTFLFSKDSLIFVDEKEINIKYKSQTNNHSDTVTYLKFEGLYQFINNKIVEKKVVGKQNKREFDAGYPYPFKKDSDNYFIFLTDRDKVVLFKKKNLTHQ